jgi:hypothetical protein
VGASVCAVHNNTLGASANPDWDATAVLIYRSNGVRVTSNKTGGKNRVKKPNPQG